MSENNQDRFAFGANWRDYADHSMDQDTIKAACAHMHYLLEMHGSELESFLDIGCGSGLFSCAAIQEGFKKVVGFDYDPHSVETSRDLIMNYNVKSEVQVMQGDVLDRSFLKGLGQFSFVYAWGSLHHTGSMWEAITNASERVADNGLFVIAIYNRSVTSPVWRWIKRVYVRSGRVIQRLLVSAVFVASVLGKVIYTHRNPFRKDRGMNFYYDVVDWAGGYPYEYATVQEIKAFVSPLGFQLVEVKLGGTPIACNEFVFKKLD